MGSGMLTSVVLGGVFGLGVGPTRTVLHAPEGADDHMRPAEFQNPYMPMPPAAAEAPEYPLAAAFVPADSSNYTAGGIASYDYVVVHTMQGYYAGSISWFQNPAANVSAHYCMRAEDGEVTQMVHDTDRAWHVGNSNSQAIGIEHEGYVDDPAWYTFATYQSSARLARWLCERHDIPVDREHIVGHVELPAQTHTDPGSYWDWDLYMALVEDVVPQGRIEGVVVDSSAACTVTASVDTWLKATPQDHSELDDADACSIPAGTELSYVWAEDPMLGHRRLTMVGGGPCAGLGELEFSGYVYEGHFDGLCDPAELVLPDAAVRLDEGTVVDVDETGHFVLEGIEPGTHTLDITDYDGFEDALESVELAVYPGARVVIAVDPISTSVPPGENPSDTDTDGPASTSGSSDGGSGDTDDGGDDASGGAAASGGALPGYGERGGETGCGCTTHGDRSPLGASLLLLFAVAGVRRRHH